jgi:hypothetical protein
MTETEVDAFFERLGFKKYKPGAEFPYLFKNLYQRRINATPCKCNDRAVINATHTMFEPSVGLSFGTVEFDITGESQDGKWFKLLCYSINPSELTDELVADITQRLANAWEAAVKA